MMRRGVMQKYRILFVFVGICILLSVLTPVFLSVNNIINVIRQVSINGILAAGMTMVIISGGIDLSVGSVAAICGAIVAGTQLKLGLVPAMLLSVATGALLGLINGLVITKGKVAPFVATLGMTTVARGLTLIYTGGRPIYNLTDAFRVLGAGYVGPIPVPVLILALVIAVVHFVMSSTVFGREVYALGGNEEAARYSGINVERRRMLVYISMGLLSAVTGIVLTSRLGSADPTAGVGFETDAIAAVVIGGTSMSGGEGSVIGSLIGALIIGVMNNGLNLLNVSPYYQQIFKGLIVVLAVLMDSASRRKRQAAALKVGR
ncbi:MAG TPA: ribose ABC transporter permease [Bacillota bacterium]|nr:ribose ABC transporter permease [Bacillota bacterium]HOL50881.1 ribose ABC transporter permease [Bacillota bacterium]HOO29694.1 ribose ABC transporter permease [Bacillota bacterium]